MTAENVGDVQAKIVLEGSNSGIDFDADQELNKKNVLVIPDLVCNSGGVICSYLEWIKNLEHKRPGWLV